MVMDDSRLLDQLLQQHLAETAGVRKRQANVLIQVKSLDSGPIDVAFSRKRVKKFDLRGCRCGHNAGPSPLRQGPTNRTRRLFRSSAAQTWPVSEDFE